ncbi:hypothetical protein MSSIT_3778 [Methanosarcina siciliae T4/M]|uniref:NodB homology domain-containing protein n=1 Tax=Methanosarcina siciliae T4/M TaxID=1434120 RepID=A0A0E3PB39_9EURY|nr:hypothetical protein [Methanosarcina siciliae]AKB30497.1 hypothetical protein MSSIT_3778 [Methanosarcina siciliae T4/M]
MNKCQLKIGIVGSEEIHIQIISELLNQQGIIFEKINQSMLPQSKYPCVIAVNMDNGKNELAKSYCINGERGIIELDINDSIYNLFTGIDDQLYLNDILCDPIVSRYALELSTKIKEAYFLHQLPFVQKWFWPNFSESCCVITHDIDSLDNSPSLKKNTLEWIRYAYYNLSNKAYCSNISLMLKEESKRDIKSSFYFFSDYGKFHRDFVKSLDQIKKAKCEIGLHGSLNSFQSPKMLIQEIEALEELTETKIFGERQHTLNFRIPHTWRYQDQIGLDYDHTFYYNDKFGFRAGLCHPYHPFDPFNYIKFNLLEIPTSFMDFTAIVNQLTLDEQKEVINKLGTTVEKYHGCLVVNFHNLYIHEKRYPSVFRLYKYTLDYIKKNGYWVATARECAQWWRKRETANLDVKLVDNILQVISDTSLPLCIEVPSGKRQMINVGNKIEINVGD